LQTPNPYLQPTDIPHLGDVPREQGRPYQIFQWIVRYRIPRPELSPDNCDAFFAPGTPNELLPNILVLDYVYGASALKHWATSDSQQSLTVLSKKHRTPPKQAVFGPKKTPRSSDDRKKSAKKRGRSTSPPSGQFSHKKTTGKGRSRVGMSTQDAFAIMNLIYNPAVLANNLAREERAERIEKKEKEDRVKNWVIATAH
jgi:hypothetical protein